MRHNPDRFKGTKAILQGQHVKTIADLRPAIKTKLPHLTIREPQIMQSGENKTSRQFAKVI